MTTPLTRCNGYCLVSFKSGRLSQGSGEAGCVDQMWSASANLQNWPVAGVTPVAGCTYVVCVYEWTEWVQSTGWKVQPYECRNLLITISSIHNKMSFYSILIIIS